ncbi:AbrB/MazE/SpoVT family DNA-binding domain-containing protein [Candidatus Woesearchaeota archaeon]|nr:AbrB/MazE/SpoVT family DNA-binding domain-containing protein [Candidatus Woesearchaeota archaeon]
MEQFEVTKLGERGQVVIPLEFRKSMGLHRGEKFIVVSRFDMLVLKRLKVPTIEHFEAMLRKGHSHAKKHGLTPKDLAEAIRKARARK